MGGFIVAKATAIRLKSTTAFLKVVLVEEEEGGGRMCCSLAPRPKRRLEAVNVPLQRLPMRTWRAK